MDQSAVQIKSIWMTDKCTSTLVIKKQQNEHKKMKQVEIYSVTKKMPLNDRPVYRDS